MATNNNCTEKNRNYFRFTGVILIFFCATVHCTVCKLYKLYVFVLQILHCCQKCLIFDRIKFKINETNVLIFRQKRKMLYLMIYLVQK